MVEIPASWDVSSCFARSVASRQIIGRSKLDDLPPLSMS
jgi:hypothetical protein